MGQTAVGGRRDAGDGGWEEKLVQRSFESFVKSSSSLRGGALEVRRLGTTATSVEIKGFLHSLSVLHATLLRRGTRQGKGKARRKLAARSLATREKERDVQENEGNSAARRNFPAVEDAARPLTYLRVRRDVPSSILISAVI